MTYPQQPGQYPGSTPGGVPAQPGGMPSPPQGMPAYPTGAYPAPAYSQAGYPQSGYPPQPPGGGTAIIAGVLASLGALFALISCVVSIGGASAISQLQGGSSLEWVYWVGLVVAVIQAVTLGAGSVMLFLRKSVGRWLIATGCAVNIVGSIVGMIGIAAASSDLSSSSNVPKAALVGGGIFGVIIASTPPIATLVLVLVPLTGRWCEWGKRPANPQTYGTPPNGMQPPQQW